MNIVFGCDPNAQDFKLALMDHVKSLGHEVTDFGDEDPIYAHTAFKVAQAVAAGQFDKGVLLCGTGIGVSIAANKVKGAYAANIHDVYQAQRAELSNHANIVTMGSQVIGIELAKMLLTEYLAHTFDKNSRSAPKVQAITDFETQQ